MAKDHFAIKVEVSMDRHMLNKTIADAVEKLSRDLAVQLQVKAALLANPDVLEVTAQEFKDGSWQNVQAEE